LVKATEVTAGLAESNGSLLPGLWRDSLHVTCGLTACTPGLAPGPTLGNEYGKTLPLPCIVKFPVTGVDVRDGGQVSGRGQMPYISWPGVQYCPMSSLTGTRSVHRFLAFYGVVSSTARLVGLHCPEISYIFPYSTTAAPC